MPLEHIPVLTQELLEYAPPHTQYLLDCTLGGGGHSLALLNQFPQAQLVALDRDSAVLTKVRNQFSPISPPPLLHHARFSDLPTILDTSPWKFDYIIADIGVSSFQLDQSDRGFSFTHDGPLDMRMDPQAEGPTAAQWVNEASAAELEEIFKKYGQERFARRIARGIVKVREATPFHSTQQLAEYIGSLIPYRFRKKKIHPATLVFQALRIAVNHELEELQTLLETVIAHLNPGGRLTMIAFHSLEDRLVKQQFQQWENPCQCPKDLPQCICGLTPLGRRIVKRAIQPSSEEINHNPRSRSAKLRVFERCQGGLVEKNQASNSLNLI